MVTVLNSAVIPTLSFHGLTQPSGGGSEQCADAFSTIQTSGSEENSELMRAQVKVRTQSGLQQIVQRRQTHRPTGHTTNNTITLYQDFHM